MLLLETKMGRELRRFFRRLRSWSGAGRDDERLRAEIEEHLEAQIEENLRAGMTPAEARRQAHVKFGPLESLRESWADERSLPQLEMLTEDTRHAFRRLRKSPAFTITTVLTLALGIGSITAIFTLVHTVILSSLAVAKPGELWRLGKEARCCYFGGYSQEKEFSLVSYELYRHFRDNTKGFTELAAFSASEQLLGIRRAGSPAPVESDPGEFVSGNYFTMFGLRPYAGRLLASSDDRPNAAPVAVMSYRLWQQSYGGDPSVIGAVFNLDQKPFTIVGITPPAFFGDTLRANPPDFFLPLNTEPYLESDTDLNTPDNHWLELIGRIAPGAAPQSIEAQMRIELNQWLRSHWGDMSANDRAKLAQQTVFLRPGGAGISAMREQFEHWLRILMAVTGFVLLIVCANVANLMLVRGLERRPQTSLSMALGARAMRLVREAVTESMLLSFAGGAAGLAIAFAGTRLIIHFAFPQNQNLPISAAPSLTVLLFALVISLLTGLVFAIAPAWMATQTDPIDALRGANRSTRGSGALARKMLVVFQAALALTLLSASGLLTAALRHLENQNFGFATDHRIVANINPRLVGYAGAQLTPLYQRIQDAVSALPGVSAAALCVYSPMGGNNWGGGVWVDGHRPPGPNEQAFAIWDRVTPGFLAVAGTKILRGRGIEERDTATAPHVAVINEAFAHRFFPNEDPLGKHFGQFGIGSERDYEIVGITEDARYVTFALDKPVLPFYFLPEAQHDFLPKTVKDANPGSHYLRDVEILEKPGVTVSGSALRRAIAAVDPNLPVTSIHTLSSQVSGQFRQQRLMARLTSFFGIVSLLLSSIGLYGVTAWNAGSRTSEMGVRMALGAARGDVVALVLRGAFGLIAAGLVLGLPFGWTAGRVLGNLLYGTNPHDPVVIAIAAAALSISAFIAALIPAVRASRVSPLDALRTE